MLRLDAITVCYGKMPALREISLEVRAGELVTLIDANGAGKTTTLKAISGLLPLTSGSIVFEGAPIGNAKPRDVLACGIAHCPEGRRVFPELTVRENLAMGAYLRRDEAGVAVLLVEHHMNLVMRVSDQVIALDFGRMIANGKPHEVRANREVVRAYLGSAD